MLKRFFKGLVGIALVSLTLASCKKDPNEITATLTVTPDATLTFKAKDNADVVLTVATNADEWKYTADEWILLTKDGDKLTVNVKENNASAANLGRIKITAGLAQPVSINVYQEAAESAGETPAQGVAVKLNAKSSVDIKTKTETEVTATVSLSIAEAAKKDVEVELFFDNGYLAEYNFLNEAEAVLFPEDKVTIPGGGKVVIPAGKTESDDIEIKLDVTTISLGKSYLVPIFVKEVNNATVKQADCRVNILVGKRNPKDVRKLFTLRSTTVIRSMLSSMNLRTELHSLMLSSSSLPTSTTIQLTTLFISRTTLMYRRFSTSLKFISSLSVRKVSRSISVFSETTMLRVSASSRTGAHSSGQKRLQKLVRHTNLTV